jgi:hypothetical protein
VQTSQNIRVDSCLPRRSFGEAGDSPANSPLLEAERVCPARDAARLQISGFQVITAEQSQFVRVAGTEGSRLRIHTSSNYTSRTRVQLRTLP